MIWYATLQQCTESLKKSCSWLRELAHVARGSLGRVITQPRTSLFEGLCTLTLDTCLDSAVQLRLEGGEDVDAVLEVALVHRLLRPPHRHEQRATDQRVLLGPSLARFPPGQIWFHYISRNTIIYVKLLPD